MLTEEEKNKYIKNLEKFCKAFQEEVERRKEVLKCGLEGIPDRFDLKYRVFSVGQTKPKFSGETALHHLKSIQTYEEIVEKCKNELEIIRVEFNSPL
tara:strand:+ start:517 stop:807 length:291 start_codon:yes stop_codon:yes gene_type:complete